MRRAHESLDESAAALQAFVRGEDSDEGEIGALLVAEFLTIFRKANTKE